MVRQEWLEDDEIPYKKQWIEDYIKEINDLKERLEKSIEYSKGLERDFSKLLVENESR